MRVRGPPTPAQSQRELVLSLNLLCDTEWGDPGDPCLLAEEELGPVQGEVGLSVAPWLGSLPASDPPEPRVARGG